MNMNMNADIELGNLLLVEGVATRFKLNGGMDRLNEALDIMPVLRSKQEVRVLAMFDTLVDIIDAAINHDECVELAGSIVNGFHY